MRGRKRSLIIGAIGVVAGVIGGGLTIASAAVPSADNTISGCYTTGNPLRIIDKEAGQVCNTGEVALSWGGGMRFRGVWTDGVGPGNIPYNSTDRPIRKGDVVRMEVPTRKFGCTTPKGSWVNVVGQHSYPCLEFPQNWAPLALDGPQGSNADVHWVSLTSTGTVRAASDAGVTTYTGTGYAYFTVPSVPDLTKCGVTATVTDFSKNLIVTAQPYGAQYILVTTKSTTGSWVAAPVDATVTCAKYS
jgi:hypothetical protein